LQTVRNYTVSERIRFKYVLESRIQTINYSNYSIKYVSNYDLSNVTLKISKIIIGSKTMTTTQKKIYVDNLNKYLIAKYTYDLSDPKNEVLKNNYIKQAMVLRNIVKTLSKQ
jgi:hypothetical protein